MVKTVGPESRVVVTRGKGVGHRKLFKGFRVSVLQDEKSYGDWLQKKLFIYLTLLNLYT